MPCLFKSDANDKWSFYQAKKIKFHSLELGVDLLNAMPARSRDGRRRRWSATRRKRSATRSESDEAQEDARKTDEKAAHVEDQALRFDFGEGLLEIGLVLTSLYFIARSKLFPVVGVDQRVDRNRRWRCRAICCSQLRRKHGAPVRRMPPPLLLAGYGSAAVGKMTGAAGGSEIDFAGFKRQRPVEHHLNRAAFGQHRIGTACQQHARETRRRSRRRADTRAHPGMPAAEPAIAPMPAPLAAALADDPRIAAFVRIALDHAFLLVEMLVAAGVDRTEPRAEIARHAVRQGDRVEPDVKLAAAFDPAGPLHFRDGPGDVTAGRDYDVAVDHDRETRFPDKCDRPATECFVLTLLIRPSGICVPAWTV